MGQYQHELTRKRRFGRSTCFLCSRPLRTKNRTDEHIFPKWLQNKFDLWNCNLSLINRTDIRYRQLRVPCCKDCNRVHLSKIEDKMKRAASMGPAAVTALDPIIPYLWMGKIYFGLLYLESLLPSDRRIKSKPILPREALEELGV
jgi:hypothetical protein